ncbi:hypothetical protein [Nostoc sp.]|uniref:hypothetical protein n=1 Tax=Nostoc sp. TaxID=1180 RepID=UPI002FF50F3D
MNLSLPIFVENLSKVVLQGSGVEEEIFKVNVRSLYRTLPYEYLLYNPKISRRNDGRLRDHDLKNTSTLKSCQAIATAFELS